MFIVIELQGFIEDKKKIKNYEVLKRIENKTKQVRQGNLGNYKTIKGYDNLYEFTFKDKGGLRIYYTFKGKTVIFLLRAGNKGTQKKDIVQANKRKVSLGL